MIRIPSIQSHTIGKRLIERKSQDLGYFLALKFFSKRFKGTFPDKSDFLS